MNYKLIGLSVLLADFIALSGYAVYHHGYFAFFDAFFGNAIGVQVFFDLVIALSIFAVWMWRDARDRGISPIPYLVAMMTLGSIGALGYLIHREIRAAKVEESGVRLPSPA